MGIVVGIDLGTTYSAVAYIDPASNKPSMVPNAMGSNITPSVVRFLMDGTVKCGQEAKDDQEAGEYGCASSFKRFISQKEPFCSFYGVDHTAMELSTHLLRHLKQQAEASLGKPVDEAVITVPAHFFDAEKRITRQAALDAGLKVRRIINEPTAAALTYGLGHWRENAAILVYDLGGGTFDVTLVGMDRNLELKTLATKGNHALGGKDWDRILKNLIIEQVLEETGVDLAQDPDLEALVGVQAEEIKRKLSAQTQAPFTIRLEGFGRYSTQITREAFEQRTAGLLENTGMLCEKVLKDAKLTWDKITDVLLVGGSTRMPQVSAYLTSRAKRTPITHVHPDEAVALGAAMQTLVKEDDYLVYLPPVQGEVPRGLFSRKNREQEQPQPAAPAFVTNRPVKAAVALDSAASITKIDIQSYGMGVIAVNPEATAYENKNIIPAGLRIPVKSARKLKFYTRANQDNEMDIFVLEGMGELKASRVLACYLVSGIRHEKGGETTIRVQYSYDRDGCVNVQARQGEDKVDLPIKEMPVPEDMSKYYQPIDPKQFKAEELFIALAVDVSGSMSGEPLRDALDAMRHFVDEYAQSDASIGVLAVSDRCQWFEHPTGDYDKCKAAIGSITCGVTGGANTGHPFKYILDEFSEIRGRRIAIVLADGVWSNQALAISVAKECHQAGIEVYGIGFGAADTRFLRDISSASANAMKVDQSQLRRTFSTIAQSIGTGSGSKGSGSQMDLTDTWDTVQR